MSPETELDLSAIKQRLQRRRIELREVIAAEQGESAPVELDQARVGRLSRMDALQGQAMSQETARRRVSELRRVEQALRRLAEGDYGYCLSCGEPISAGRLAVDLAATQCIACASRTEQER